jgi:hypothetical protein
MLKGEILGSHSGVAEDSLLRRCDAKFLGEWFQTFRRIMLPSFLGWSSSRMLPFETSGNVPWHSISSQETWILDLFQLINFLNLAMKKLGTYLLWPVSGIRCMHCKEMKTSQSSYQHSYRHCQLITLIIPLEPNYSEITLQLRNVDTVTIHFSHAVRYLIIDLNCSFVPDVVLFSTL